MALSIWTVGHSTRPEDDFIALLRAHRIEAIADVRRFPGSKRHPQFAAERLRNSLAKDGIQYIHFPDLGGGVILQRIL